jgi:hypothetical protein
MKFRDIGEHIVKRRDQRDSVHDERKSSLLDKSITANTQSMKENIKNSFTDKLGVMKNQIRLHDFEENNSMLKATSHVAGIPSLLPPQLSFEVVECIRANKLLDRSLEQQHSKVGRSSIYEGHLYDSVDYKFRHRTGVKELEAWLKKKLDNPPKT